MKEIDEAKKEIMMYKRKGYPILTADGTPMERFNPNLNTEPYRATARPAASIPPAAKRFSRLLNGLLPESRTRLKRMGTKSSALIPGACL